MHHIVNEGIYQFPKNYTYSSYLVIPSYIFLSIPFVKMIHYRTNNISIKY